LLKTIHGSLILELRSKLTDQPQIQRSAVYPIHAKQTTDYFFSP